MGKPMLAMGFFATLGLCKRSLHPAAISPCPPRVVGHPLRIRERSCERVGDHESLDKSATFDDTYLLLEDFALLCATVLLGRLLRL
jgi:hypothetical protein